MRRPDAGARLAPEQAAVAETGLKGMMPVPGRSGPRPFLDYVLSTLAGAGCDDICLVVAPDHDVLRRHYQRLAPVRVHLQYAVQAEPRGTADAVASAEAFAGRDTFLVVNSDNYYPPAACRALTALGRPGLVAFDRDALVALSNIEPERVLQYAIVAVNASGELVRIVEKPDRETAASMEGGAYVSMNLWAFGPEIFTACRAIGPSARGELELADAVQYATSSLGTRFAVVRFSGPVLDLSGRADVAEVGRRLQDTDVDL